MRMRDNKKPLVAVLAVMCLAFAAYELMYMRNTRRKMWDFVRN